MITVTDFILARVAEEEATADLDDSAGHVTPHERARAARTLARCAAMRKIVNGHGDMNDGDCCTCVQGLWGYPAHGGCRPLPWPCPTVRALASIWSDHPDWREEWR